MKRNLPILILSVIVSGLTAYGVVKISGSQAVRYNGPESVPPIHKVNLSDQLYPDFTFAAENAVSSVVHVNVTKRGMAIESYSIFDFFFGYGGQNSVPREQASSGSGVIIRPDGYIVTNNHVVEGADNISVTLYNKKTYNATLLGSDPVTDIALIKIESGNLPYLTFGDSDALRLGEWVLAIGNPYNLTSTITAGIVSAKARSIPAEVSPQHEFMSEKGNRGEFKIESFIQTDAAVNPGNSGGALVNTRGELVGINTAIASRTGSFTGYSFAVPSLIAKKVVEDIIDFGSVKRAVLGISMQDITGDLAKEKNLSDTKGAYIAEVLKGSAADKAGIKISDILISVNGKEVNSAPAVQEQISKYRPGDKINVGIIRDSKQKEISVVLEKSAPGVAEWRDKFGGDLTLFGADLRKASDETLKKYDLRHGVEVISVEEGKFKDAGIKPGFVITHVNQYPVRGPQDILNVIQRSRRSLFIEGQYSEGRVIYYGIGL